MTGNPLPLEVGRALGADVLAATPLGGASTGAAFRLALADGSHLFVKTWPGAPPDFFAVERDGLAALAAAGGLRVPGVRAVAPAWIALEWIETGAFAPACQARLGERLAAHHYATAREQHGWHRDGYIGRTPQPNPRVADGAAFWRDARLAPQLARARQHGRATPEMVRLGEGLLYRLPALLPADTPACLLHGDLWRGNAACAEGQPVVFDPAAYYGPREAELALCHLFGGFGAAFFDAYQSAWPLDAGAAGRRDLYALYHLLNHLNLFGAAYFDGVMDVLRRYA